MTWSSRNFPKGAGDWKPEGEMEMVGTDTDNSLSKETAHG